MNTPCEYTLVEKPIIDGLVDHHGYRFIPPSQHPALRARENEVLFRPVLIAALMRLNGIPAEVATAIFHELSGITDNQRWLDVLRGNYSRKVPGEDTHRTIRLLDFDNVTNNDFAVTNQLRVVGEVTRKPDLVVYVNGIPLVVIEAKSPLNPGQNAFDAIDQVRSCERDTPRLFASNLFNIATNDTTFLYAATGSPSEHWTRWRDPWPRKSSEFADETQKGLYALLEPSRLLDLLAHFVVFETRDGKTLKKIARYQQYRAVNKMVERVVGGKQRQGLIWHTQGSGKSLTMAFAALKLKFHRGIRSERLANPNLLIITDRIDLHDQITKTFVACGLPNPINAQSIDALKQTVVPGVSGRTVMSTIFKFHWDDPRLKSDNERVRGQALRDLVVAGSENWILMVDECHRTQEKDLGAYIRAILPNAVRFGFTGTPVKKGDKDTFANFGVPGESYLDKYGIQDAVNDGATVPVFYQARLTKWKLDEAAANVQFDQTFSDLSAEQIAELRERGVTKGDLARLQARIGLIALDIWTHYREFVKPDGFKAQVVAIDRLACVAYKKALDTVIAAWLVNVQKVDSAEAHARATAMSACVYSPGQHDGEQHPELVEQQVSDEELRNDVLPRFFNPADPLVFLIVCNKLLTGFDAPIEQAMCLDSPLTDHNLLQAIARTNRRHGSKAQGLILDYIGLSTKLAQALAAYNAEDVQGALTDFDALHDELRAAHRAVMELIEDVPRGSNLKQYINAVIALLTVQEDDWFTFRAAASRFLSAYGALSPDPRVLTFQADFKLIGAILQIGELKVNQNAEIDWSKYSVKIREILDAHLKVTGLDTVLKLRSLSDPAFWEDFSVAGKSPEDLQTAAVRKLAELKKQTTERAARNPTQYGSFAERVQELIAQFQQGMLEAAGALAQAKAVAEAVQAEDAAHEGSGLSRRAYGMFKILDAHRLPIVSEPDGPGYAGAIPGSPLEKAALAIDDLYASDATAPSYWQDKATLKKDLRAVVRRLLMPLALEGWAKELPQEIENFAVLHYGKP